jgi:hypothetical protein
MSRLKRIPAEPENKAPADVWSKTEGAKKNRKKMLAKAGARYIQIYTIKFDNLKPSKLNMPLVLGV